MTLSIRSKPYSLPSYSLTGDLIGFLRCGLQYRYQKIGRMPPSRPVQIWFGEFIHGVMDEAYRRFDDLRRRGKESLPPWSLEEIDDICNVIEKRLNSRGLKAWNEELKEFGKKRAVVAIQELGPHLFPLIQYAEVRLNGARPLPKIKSELQFRDADRYEITGVVDVISSVELSKPEHENNLIVKIIKSQLGDSLPNHFEIIIDYKGMRRPNQFNLGKRSLWEQYEWQVQTYAELRRRQKNSKNVIAGVLLYINELAPSLRDLNILRDEVRQGITDVRPITGSVLDKNLNSGKLQVKDIPFDFRMTRALHVVPVNEKTIENALIHFDKVVQHIETCRGLEVKGESILKCWDRNADDQSTCEVCDARTYCPDFQKNYASRLSEKEPKIPGYKK
jgi:hypothetical protein